MLPCREAQAFGTVCKAQHTQEDLWHRLVVQHDSLPALTTPALLHRQQNLKPGSAGSPDCQLSLRREKGARSEKRCVKAA